MEQHEYRERMNHYFNKLRTMNTTKVQWSMPNHCILIDIPNPDKILFSDISISKPEYNHVIMNFLYYCIKNSFPCIVT